MMPEINEQDYSIIVMAVIPRPDKLSSLVLGKSVKDR